MNPEPFTRAPGDPDTAGDGLWTVLCAADDVPPDFGLRAEPDGHPAIAVFRLGGAFHATADTCTHGAASLCDGHVEDGQVECPWHAGRFDIRTGEATASPCTEPLRVYRTRLVDGQVQALVPLSA